MNFAVQEKATLIETPTSAPRISHIDVSLLLVRVIVGIIFMAHGGQKLFGLWGGMGLATTMEKMGPVLGFLVTIGEFFGGLGLVLGVLTRFSAASLIVIMMGAIALAHGKNGFFLSNEGYEYNLALIGLCLPVLISGAGLLSLGRYLPFLPKSRDRSRPAAWIE